MRAIEVEEPQRDRAGAVGEPAQQRAPPAYGDLAELDDALDEHLVADRETADRAQRRAVLVALRQQAQQVAERPHAELGEPLGDLRAYARQALDRPIEQRLRLRSDSGRLQDENAVDLDGGAARQLRDADRRARRIRLLAVLRHDLVDERKSWRDPSDRPSAARRSRASRRRPRRPPRDCRTPGAICARMSPLTISIVVGFSGICPDR